MTNPLLGKYIKYLLNAKINVTSYKNVEEIREKLILPSLSLFKYIKPYNVIVDAGTGGGIPGIPLAIENKDKKFILIDSIQKKTEFLKEFCIENNIKNVEIINNRIENLEKQYDIILTRSMGPIQKVLKYVKNRLKKNGLIIIQTSPNIEKLPKNKYFILIKKENIDNIIMNLVYKRT